MHPLTIPCFKLDHKKISMERIIVFCMLKYSTVLHDNLLFLGMCTREHSVTLLWIGYMFTSACLFPDILLNNEQQ
jgi:hypothetical protein